jgi:hypothetical protein
LQYLQQAAAAIEQRNNELAAIPAAELSDSDSEAPEYGHLSHLLKGEGVLQQAIGFSQTVRCDR